MHIVIWYHVILSNTNLKFQVFQSNVNNLHNQLIGLVGRVFTNGPGDQGSVPGCVLPKTLKNGTCLTLSIIRYISRVKWSDPGEVVVVPSPTPRCSSY